MSSFKNFGTAQPIGRPQSYFDFGPDFDDDGGIALERETHRIECQEEQDILAGSVEDLLSWFHEESDEYTTLQAIVAKAAEERAEMELERERVDADQYSPI